MFVPLAMGLYRKPVSAMPAIASMLVGLGLWLLHYFADWRYFFEPWTSGLPLKPEASLTMTAFSLLVYLVTELATKERPT